MKLEIDNETGFGCIKEEDYDLVAVIANNEDSLDTLKDQVDMTIDFNDSFLEKLFEKMNERYGSIGALIKIQVSDNARGIGIGSKLMESFESDVSSKTEVDLLFARINNNQRKGFSLKKFYENRGFEAVKYSEGNLLMVNKGQAKVIMDDMNLARENRNENSFSM